MSAEELMQLCDKYDGIYTIATCLAPNWNHSEHRDMVRLYHNPNQLEGYTLSYEINWGVHDWTIISLK